MATKQHRLDARAGRDGAVRSVRPRPHQPGALAAALCAAIVGLAGLAAPVQAQSADRGASAPVEERFKDWALQCTQEQTPRTCFLVHDVYLTEGEQRILQVVVGRFGPGNALAAILFVPLGIRLPPGVGVRIDEGAPVQLQLERCTARGCQAQVALAEPLLGRFKAGLGGEVTFEDATGRQMAVPFSLLGFSAGLAKLP